MQGVLPTPKPAREPAPEQSQLMLAGRRPSAMRVGLAERRTLLVFGDLVALNVALWLVLRLGPHPTWLNIPENLPLSWDWFTVLSALWLLIGTLTECFDLAIAGSRFASPYRAATVTALTLVVYTFVPYVTPPVLKSRLVWMLLMLAGTITIAAWRLLFASVAGHPVLVSRSIIVGAGESGRLVAEAIETQGGGVIRPLGFVSVDGERAVDGATLRVLGSAADLPELLATTAADELIVASAGPLPSEAYRAIASAYENGVRVTPMTSLYEGLTGRIPVEHIGEQWLAVLPQTSTASLSYVVVKRLLDIAGGLVGLMIGIVLMPVLALAIWIDSPGGVFFSQDRVGQRGKRFRIYKLRTVARPQADAAHLTIWERKVTPPTRVGRWLRRTRLDELPQFWNVLRGDMSLVGPRPFVPQEIEELQRRIPFFRSRLLVKPGITGWAQVNGTYGVMIEDELVKLQYDLYYIRHQSIALDLIVLIKTVAVVLRFAGR